MKAHRGSRGIGLLFLWTQGQIGVGGQRHAPGALLPGKRPVMHCTGRWIGPRDRSGHVWRISRPSKFDPRTVQSVASRYTDRAIPAPLVFIMHINILKPTGYVMHQQFNIQQLYVLPTLYLCFVFIWEQTATSATYSINWLVFITEMKSVYCAVRTGSLNKAVYASSLTY